MLRSFPVNGTGFLVFEMMMRATGRKNAYEVEYEWALLHFWYFPTFFTIYIIFTHISLQVIKIIKK